MTEYAKHVREKKEQEMKEEEQRKQAEDPDYKPKKPLSPTMPKKEKEDDKKADEKKTPQSDKTPPSTKTLFDQIQEQKELRERQKKEDDPNYKPKTLPKKQFKDDDLPLEEEPTLFE